MTSYQPAIEPLESRYTLSGSPLPNPGLALFATSSDPGVAATLTVFDSHDQLADSIQPFGTAYTNGFHVAMADVNGDGTLDLIAGTEAGVPATVLVYDGKSILNGTPQGIAAFHPFGPSMYKWPVRRGIQGPSRGRCRRGHAARGRDVHARRQNSVRILRVPDVLLRRRACGLPRHRRPARHHHGTRSRRTSASRRLFGNGFHASFLPFGSQLTQYTNGLPDGFLAGP